MTRRSPYAAARGFTLVEAIVVMVVIGILAAVVAVFVRAPMMNYAETLARAELADQADLATRRIARDLRLALPNSVRVNSDGSAVEFMLTKAGGRYLAVEDGAPGSPLDFANAANKEFTVVGATTSLSSRINAATDYVVVNNGAPGTLPTDAYQFVAAPGACASCNIAAIDTVTWNGSDVATIRLKDNPFGRQGAAASPSPGQRFHLVSGPVMYACASDGKGAFTLTRYWNYPIAASMNVPPAGAARAAPLATGVDHCNELFSYESSAQRVGLVLVKLSLRARNDNVTPISLVHQVHVDNAP